MVPALDIMLAKTLIGIEVSAMLKAVMVNATTMHRKSVGRGEMTLTGLAVDMV